MGFMAGFGKAFSNSFENAQTRKAEKEKDAFRLAYDSFTSKKSSYDKASSEDSAAMKKAQLMIADTGADLSALGETAERIRSGYSDKDVREFLKNNSFAPLPSTDDAPATPTVEPATMETQTEQALGGQTATASENGPNPFEQTGKLITDLLDPAKRQQGRIAQANTQVQEAMGLTEEEFNSIMGGYTPSQSPRAQITPKNVLDIESDPTKSVYLEIDGQMVPGYVISPGKYADMSLNPIEEGRVTNVLSQQNVDDRRGLISGMPTTKDVQETRTNSLSLTKSLYNLDKMAQDNPVVLTRSSAVSTVLNELGNEFSSIGSQINEWTGGQVSKAQENMINKLAGELVANGVNASDAQAYAALEVAVKFDIARLMSGPGPLSESDRAAGDTALKTNDAAIFMRIAKQLAQKSISDTNDAINAFANDPMISEGKKFGVDLTTNLKPVEDDLPDEVKEWLNNNPASSDPSSNTTGSQPEAGQAVSFDPEAATPLDFTDALNTTFQGKYPHLVGKTVYTMLDPATGNYLVFDEDGNPVLDE